MVGAAALTALAAMRCGAGLVTIGIPKSLNAVIQKKISPVIMTLPLKETTRQTLSAAAFSQIHAKLSQFAAIALGPGLTTHPGTQQFVIKIISSCKTPMVIDADALNILAKHLSILKKNKAPKVLTPHPGEMSRLTNLSRNSIEKNRRKTAGEFAKKFHCTLLLKGHRTIVASAKGRVYINSTGNAGMATAGSGDVLTGIIAAFLAQGLSDFESAKWGAYIHGKAGDLAAKKRTKLSMIATDIIEQIPHAVAGRSRI